MGLRELARRIAKSPAFVVALELERNAPGVAEETLRDIARELGLDGDLLVTLAGKTPEDVTPKNPLEVALYRRIRDMSREQQQRLLEGLDSGEWNSE
jgi:hypothetical protein